MGLLDFLRGIKKPNKNTPILSQEKLEEKLLALNRKSAPYEIRDGKDEKVDLVGEWKIVDAKWYQVFAKAGLKRIFKVLLVLDPEKKEVRSVDKSFTVKWSVGVPSLSIEASAFRGQQMEKSFGTAYAFTEELKPGVVYKYRFDTSEIKKPIIDTVLSCGWTFKKVAFGKL